MSPSLPHIVGRDLCGARKELPGDLSATYTFVIAALRQDHHGVVDRLSREVDDVKVSQLLAVTDE